ncbi:plastocyanin/azurin family copper-binding protein [Chryseobacterium sp. R2A-55]|uniref:plastocyanin/azurin family copper-binding protein n=1 Tax=Chryseobacterium sp. R2A-55 TaxID=2744445 RepID=UPI001F1DAD87|nr:plastocyanin/azurin family copper-binding protein [Chryseobacterium sp. R2A-55]
MKTQNLGRATGFTILLFLACSCVQKGDSIPETSDTAAENPGSTAPPTVAKADTILIRQMKFNPQELHVNKGATVIFVNKDVVAHDVTSKDKKTYSDTIKVNQSWTWVANDSMSYYCSIHPTMLGKVLINP